MGRAQITGGLDKTAAARAVTSGAQRSSGGALPMGGAGSPSRPMRFCRSPRLSRAEHARAQAHLATIRARAAARVHGGCVFVACTPLASWRKASRGICKGISEGREGYIDSSARIRFMCS